MVNYELLRDTGILIIRPQDSLEAADFEKIAREIDPYIESNGALNGVMIDAKSFPGWKDFAALVAHLKFVKDHHRKIEKIAAVSDSNFLAIAPKIIAACRGTTGDHTLWAIGAALAGKVLTAKVGS